MRGRLIPREGGDILAAKINNELLSFQWDQATHAGTMISKYAMMDINTRKYGASFALSKWRYQEDKKKKVLFDGPEMRVLNNRDCLPDPTATSIEDCNWFQVRDYVTLQELESVNDRARGKPIYQNLSKLRDAVGKKTGAHGSDTRASNWTSRSRVISGLTEDPLTLNETVFQRVEVVTEYRRDRWFTFAPKHGVLLRDIENPYENNEIPITMLRYYQVDDDLYGLSEIEPVKGIQKAINAILSQYVDEINQKLYSPIAIGPGVRQKTLEWGKGARWLMNNPLTDFKLVESKSNAAAFFNSTYSALVGAFMNAIGETSLGISNLGPYQKEKTATEVKQLITQRNARDSFNQVFLAEAIQRQMRLWFSMNQVMLFNDPDKTHHILGIVGKDAMKYFENKGLANDKHIPDDVMGELADNPELKPEDFAGPKYPVNFGTEEEPDLKPKFNVDETGTSGTLYVEPDDLMGYFDFIADVESMAVGTLDSEKEGRRMAISTLMTNPNASQMLQMEGVKPKFKELFVAWLEDSGFKDADQYFESVQEGPPGTPPGTPPGLPPKPPEGAPPGAQPGSPPPQLPNIVEQMRAAESPPGKPPAKPKAR